MRGTDCDGWVAIEPIARQTGERVAIVDRIPLSIEYRLLKIFGRTLFLARAKLGPITYIFVLLIFFRESM